MKKSSLALFLILIIFFNTASLGAKIKYVPDTSLDTQNLIIVPAKVSFYLLGRELNIPACSYYANGRLYIPLIETVSAIGGTISLKNNIYTVVYNNKLMTVASAVSSDNIKPLIYRDSKPYISFYYFSKSLCFAPVFDSLNNIVDLYYDGGSVTIKDVHIEPPKANAKKAYLRLEDIIADGQAPNAVYTDDGLEKLRVIASYLKCRNQEFYIAWVPIYFNPGAKISNDISKEYNLYNSHFIYTLDYMIDNGGHLGLHGLTHQYGDEISTVGFEFNEKSPYTDSQIMARMIQAKTIAKKLGYTPEFWEFPHYGATPNAFHIAEHYFDVIYQPSPYRLDDGQIHVEEYAGKKTTYIPTPGEYVHNVHELNSSIMYLDKIKKENKLMSVFIHPILDFDRIIVQNNEEGSRLWHYPPYIVYPSIVDKAIYDGYTFSSF